LLQKGSMITQKTIQRKQTGDQKRKKREYTTQKIKTETVRNRRGQKA